MGDKYADNAYEVTVAPNTNFMRVLVEQHWIETAGPLAYMEKFDQVAKQHFQQYVSSIGNDLMLPNSMKIEESYRKAVTDAGLPVTTAFDGVFTNSAAVAFDYLWPGDKSNGLDWTDFLWMEDERQVPSEVFGDITFEDARSILGKDLLSSIEAFGERNFLEFALSFSSSGDVSEFLKLLSELSFSDVMDAGLRIGRLEKPRPAHCW